MIGGARILALTGAVVLLAACGSQRSGDTGPDATAASGSSLFERLDPYCGKAYAGRVVADEPASPDPGWQQPAVVHFRACEAQGKVLTLHLGDDRSRAWMINRSPRGLALHHAHHHADGSADAVTGYGGFARGDDTGQRVEFPADDNTKMLFQANDLAVSVDNVWALELVEGETLVYELNRPQRHFRIEFDLGREVETPPLAWAEAPIR